MAYWPLMYLVSLFRKLISRGGVILAGGAIASKGLGLVRDRIITNIFPDPAIVDGIFASFRIPDFFFFLLIAGPVSTVLIPRVASVSKEQHSQYVSSFLWMIASGFGLLCITGLLFTPQLINIIGPGFAPSIKAEMVPLSRWLFGSVFLLSISSVFAAYLQQQERFWTIAMAPLLYTASICIGIYFYGETSIKIVGQSAVIGALLHMGINASAYLWRGEAITRSWKQPLFAWNGFWSDFAKRITTAGTVQIIHIGDVIIASYLLQGSLTAFIFGSALGHLLFTIIGMSFANAVFPKFTAIKHQNQAQKILFRNTFLGMTLFTVPFMIVSLIFAEPITALIYNIDGERLSWAADVYRLTVMSLPFACAIPLLSRWFLSNDDTDTPLKISAIGAFLSLSVAALLALVILPPEQAVLGLGIGNIITNTTISGGMAWVLYKRLRT